MNALQKRGMTLTAALAAALLTACGGGYDVTGGFVWRPNNNNDDARVNIGISKHQLDAQGQVLPILQASAREPQPASAEVRAALMQLRSQDAGHCAAGAQVWELTLSDASGSQHFRSDNWDCADRGEGASHGGFVDTQQLQRLAELLAQ